MGKWVMRNIDVYNRRHGASGEVDAVSVLWVGGKRKGGVARATLKLVPGKISGAFKGLESDELVLFLSIFVLREEREFRFVA